jgi:DNA-3-methyladenine glycosylase II
MGGGRPGNRRPATLHPGRTFDLGEAAGALRRQDTDARGAAAAPTTLRKAGLSNAKVEFLRDLAARVKDGRLDLKRLAKLADEDVVAELIEVKGVGQWTAEMFLIFHLGRPDVVSVGDLGIRRAVQIAYGMKELPGPEELEKLAEEWRPHRTLACLYLWRSLDNMPVETPAK